MDEGGQETIARMRDYPRALALVFGVGLPAALIASLIGDVADPFPLERVLPPCLHLAALALVSLRVGAPGVVLLVLAAALPAALSFALEASVVVVPVILLWVTAKTCRVAWLAASPRARWPFTAGLALGVAALIPGWTPQVLSEVGVRRAASDDPATARAGVLMLRRQGEERILRRLVHERAPALDDVQAERLYYRVTGEPLAWQPPDPRGAERPPDPRFALDPDLVLGGRVARGLAVTRSDIAIDVHLGGHATIDWTLELRRWEGPVEVAMVIALPPGGAVTSLGWRSQDASAAEVVTISGPRSPGDAEPLAVATAAGPGRALLQASVFEATTLQIRVIAPLEQGPDGAVALALPRIVDRSASGPPRHRLDVASDAPLHLTGRAATTGRRDDRHTLKATLEAPAMLTRPVRLVVDAYPGTLEKEPAGAVCAREGSPVVLLVDATPSVQPHIETVLRVLDRLPRDARVEVVLADEPPVLVESARARAPLQAAAFEGGVDPLPGLAVALDRAAALEGAVVWVHGPHRVRLSSTAGLRDRGDVPIVTLEAAQGDSRVLASLEPVLSLRPARWTGDLSADLEAALADPGGVTREMPRSVARRAAVTPTTSVAVVYRTAGPRPPELSLAPWPPHLPKRKRPLLLLRLTLALAGALLVLGYVTGGFADGPRMRPGESSSSR